jgi:flavin-dependent dehydrogenase
MFDVIVVGARCAGAPAAMLLGRKGYKVLLVDRATFPSDIPHGHFIHRHGPRRLARWGLLDRIVSTDCPPVTSNIVDLGDFPLAGRGLIVDGVALGYGPRRSALDKMLVDAAVEAGVELRQGFSVEDVVTDGDRVIGIRGRASAGGVPVTEHARVTVGADGRHSRVAAAVRAPVYDAVPPVACWYFSYWSGIADSGFEMYARRDKVIFVFPTNDGLTAIFVGWPIHALPTVRANIDAHFTAAFDEIPGLAERVRCGRREERFFGATDLPNFFRKPYGAGWALAGDAGCHKDPYLALGMCDAFRDVEWLVEAIDTGLSGSGNLQDALEDYERRRNDASRQDYWQNLNAARFIPPPDEVFRIRAAVRGDEDATTQFFLAHEGMIPRDAFFNPENLDRLLSGRSPQGAAIDLTPRF